MRWRRHVPTPREPQLILGTITDAPRQRRELLVVQGSVLAAHKHVIGTTGSGKSMGLLGMGVQLPKQGIGVGALDPTGDLCDDYLALMLDTGFYADERAYERLWYVPFNDATRSIPFNVLNQPYEPHTVARHLLEAWKRTWPALSGGSAPNLEQIVLSSSIVLIENRLPITNLERLLTEAPFRDRLLARTSDTEVVAFFRSRYAEWGRRANLLTESTSRRAFLMQYSPALRYSLGQTENRLNFRRIMDEGITVLFDLSGLDEDTQRFLGCLITVGFETAALSRSDLPPDQRRPYHLIIDEFSQFAATSETAFERVLALTRKYGLTLTLAHQTWSQASHKLAGALQNALLICHRLGPDDAAWAAARLCMYDPERIKRHTPRGAPVFMSAAEQRLELQQELQLLPPAEAYVRLGDTVHRVRTLQIPTPRATRDDVRRVKEHYAQLLLTKHAAIREMETRTHQADSPEDGVPPRPQRELRRRVRLEGPDEYDSI